MPRWQAAAMVAVLAACAVALPWMLVAWHVGGGVL